MTNDLLKEYIKEHVSDDEITNDIVLLEGDEFAPGFIGLTADTYQAVYSYEKLIVSLTAHNHWTSEEATEWLEYNTLRSIPYMPGKKPIIIYEY